MSLERRRELLELSQRHQVPILDDDSYSELCYDEENIPSLRALDTQGNPRVTYHGHQTYLVYNSSAVEMGDPAPADTWPVGARRAITWGGQDGKGNGNSGD